MGFLDLLLLIFDNLGRRKARVALTAVGVVIGTAAVVVLVSLAIGLQRNANQQLGGIGDLTTIQVSPTYGDMGSRGPFMSAGGGGSSSAPSKQTLITDQSLRDFAAIPGVSTVVPRDYLQGGSVLKLGRLENYPQIIGVGLSDLADLGLATTEGATTLAKGQGVSGVMVARNFYDPRLRPGQDPPPPPDLMTAKDLKLIISRYSQDGKEVHKEFPIHINGMLTESRGESDYSIYLPIEDVAMFNEFVQGRRINRNRDGYSMAMVKVKDLDRVLDIADQISGMGYQVYTPQSFVQGINSFYVVLQVIFGGVGAIALLVAAIGIANTMAMAILERTREIGLMKAIGATNRDVLSVFLGEAAGIGFIGGLGGVLLGWSAGQVLNVLALSYLVQQMSQTGGPPPSVAVYTPMWLPIFALVFATVIGLLSGLYPALRAATLIPVHALKYE